MLQCLGKKQKRGKDISLIWLPKRGCQFVRLWTAFRKERLVFLWVGWGDFAVISEDCKPLSEQRVWFLKRLQIAFENSRFWKATIGFRRKPSVIPSIYMPLSRRKSADFALQPCDFRHRKQLWSGNITGCFRIKPRLTSGCSPSPAPSPHGFGSGACPAEPRVMRFLLKQAV